MKRRSARPFTVEIKHTRISRALVSDATERSRSGKDLCHDLPVVAADKTVGIQKVEPGPVVHSEPAQPAATARRVLPSLVPMFSMPVEPGTSGPREAPTEERLPRVRSVKPTSQRGQKRVVKVAPAPLVAAKPRVQLQVKPVLAAPAVAQTSTLADQSASVQAHAARRARQQRIVLRPGERWKRRLPRVLW